MKSLPILSPIAVASCLVAGIFALAVVFAEADDPDRSPQAASEPVKVSQLREQSASRASEAAIAILRKSRDALLLRHSVSAKLKENVSIGSSRFQASGTYEAAEFPKLRLNFEVNVGNTTGSLLQVCDGQLLWTVQEIAHREEEKPSLHVSRVVIDELLSALKDSKHIPEAVLIANLGMGGLPTLLASLERSMIFDAHKVIEDDGKPYTVIQGGWNEEYRARLSGGKGGPLPAHIPDRVRIYFDQQADFPFPVRVLYLKERATAANVKSYQLLLSLEFTDVVVDGPVSEDQFHYFPPEGLKVENRTDKFIEMINAAKSQASEAGAAR